MTIINIKNKFDIEKQFLLCYTNAMENNSENTILASSLEEATKIDDSIFEKYFLKDNLDEMFDADEFIPIYGINKSSFCNLLLEYGKKMKYDKLIAKTLQESNYKKIRTYVKTNKFSIKDLPCNDPFLNDYVIDEALFNHLIQDIKDTDSVTEKICKFYIRACRTLSFDPTFYAAGQKGKIAHYHEDINNLKNITLERPIVVCYEFSAIVAKFLQSIGIKYMVNSLNPTEYGKTHKSVTTEADNIPILIDASKLMFHDDFYHAKVCQTLVGLKCLSSKKSDQEKFNNTFIKVYNEYLATAVDNFSSKTATLWAADYEDLKYYNIAYSVEGIDSKLEILKKYQPKNLPYFERICHMAFIARTLYDEEIKNGQFHLSCIKNNNNGLPMLAFATNTEKNGVAHPTKFWLNKYMIYNGKTIEEYTMQNLQDKFDNEDFSYIYKSAEINKPNTINYEKRLPGIFDYGAPQNENE